MVGSRARAAIALSHPHRWTTTNGKRWQAAQRCTDHGATDRPAHAPKHRVRIDRSRGSWERLPPTRWRHRNGRLRRDCHQGEIGCPVATSGKPRSRAKSYVPAGGVHDDRCGGAARARRCRKREPSLAPRRVGRAPGHSHTAPKHNVARRTPALTRERTRVPWLVARGALRDAAALAAARTRDRRALLAPAACQSATTASADGLHR